MQVCNSLWIIAKIKTREMCVWAKFAKISSRENFYLYSTPFLCFWCFWHPKHGLHSMYLSLKNHPFSVFLYSSMISTFEYICPPSRVILSHCQCACVSVNLLWTFAYKLCRVSIVCKFWKSIKFNVCWRHCQLGICTQATLQWAWLVWYHKLGQKEKFVSQIFGKNAVQNVLFF